MANEQNNEQKNSPRDQARNLFFETGLTQAQIAELVGVSQKTISLWMNEGKWKQLQESACLSPTVLIEQMVQELRELHSNIAAREPGKRYASLQEAETRRKIMSSIKYIQDRETVGRHTEVMMNFMNYVKRRNLADAKKILPYADDYLRGELKLGQDAPFTPYPLPGTPSVPPRPDSEDQTPQQEAA